MMTCKRAIRSKEVLESSLSELTNSPFTENVGTGQETGQSELIDESTSESHPRLVEDAHVRSSTETMQLLVMGEAHHLENTEGQRENNPLDESTRCTRGRDHRNPQHGGNGDRSSQTTPVNRKTTGTPRNEVSTTNS